MGNLVVIGKIGAPFGVVGWSHINAFTNPKENILDYGVWKLKIRGEYQDFAVEQSRVTPKGVVAKLRDISNRDLAAGLTNKEIYVARQDFPDLEEGEYYWSDLENLEVVDQNGEIIGTVDYLYNAGANDVMIVKKKDNAEIHLPFIIGDWVLEVSLNTGKIIVNLQNLNNLI